MIAIRIADCWSTVRLVLVASEFEDDANNRLFKRTIAERRWGKCEREVLLHLFKSTSFLITSGIVRANLGDFMRSCYWRTGDIETPTLGGVINISFF